MTQWESEKEKHSKGWKLGDMYKGFWEVDMDNFHTKARKKIRRLGIRPEVCSICGRSGKIDAHHPWKDVEEDWKEVIFVCKNCHLNIHKGKIKMDEKKIVKL